MQLILNSHGKRARIHTVRIQATDLVANCNGQRNTGDLSVFLTADAIERLTGILTDASIKPTSIQVSPVHLLVRVNY